MMPGERKPIDEKLPALYEKSDDLQTSLDNYLKTPVIAALGLWGRGRPCGTIRRNPS